MRNIFFYVTGMLAASLVLAGCEGSGAGAGLAEPAEQLGEMIGDVVEVFSYDTIPVEGYALVGGLDGTGSAECPPGIRQYLEKYIMRSLPQHKADVEKIISSPDTAVVYVRGLMPTSGIKNNYFDVRVDSLAATQTTSLEGGWLYGSELKPIGAFAVSTKILANAEGPVFIDTIDSADVDKRSGFVLGGARPLEDYKITLALQRPDYRMANLIRNRLNSRYGYGTAYAVSEAVVELKLPDKYRGQRERFIRLVEATYLQESAALQQGRILTAVRTLAAGADKDESEIALEAIGKASLEKLGALLGSSKEEVRFRAARSMLNIGSDAGLDALREMAFDVTSPYRLQAIDAIGTSASYNDATAILRRLLLDDTFDIRLRAYEHLRNLDDISIAQELIAGDFYLEQIAYGSKKGIFVSRSGQPRIVLFGAPIYCRDEVFVESSDGDVTINSTSGQTGVSIIRRHPKRANVVIRLESTSEMSDIIRTLSAEPVGKSEGHRAGLGISYADVIAIIKRMVEIGAVDAQFRAGPLPKIELNIKRIGFSGR